MLNRNYFAYFIDIYYISESINITVITWFEHYLFQIMHKLFLKQMFCMLTRNFVTINNTQQRKKAETYSSSDYFI